MIMLVTIFFASLLLGQLGAITPVANVTIYSHDVALGFLLIAAGVRRKKLHRGGRLQRPIIAFVTAGVLSLLINASRFAPLEIAGASPYLLRWFFYALLYWLVVSGSINFRFWLGGLYGVGTTLGALGLVQYFLYPALRNLYYLGWDEHYYRVFSTLLDPNFTGILLVLNLFLGQYLWQEKKYWMLVFFGQIVTIMALFLTYSRSSFLAFLVGLFTLAFLQKWWRGVGIGILFLLFLVFLPQNGGEGVRLLRSTSGLARLGNWQRGFELIKAAPWFGHGFNTLRYAQGKPDNSSQFPSRAGAGLDSSLQFVWATTGIIGLSAYLWLLAQMAKVAIELRRKRLLLGSVLAASLVGLLIHSLFTNSLFYPWVMIWLWILWGAAETTFTSGKSRAAR